MHSAHAPRSLKSLDRIIAVSAAHFRAADSGQISLFGEHTGVVEEIHLPPVSVQIGRREVLNWERELIGLYVSDHPLSPVMEDLQDVVTHFSGQLTEVNENEKVRVLGIITRIRHHRSKAGKPMAFVTMEDLQGAVDLVIFPRIWDKVSSMVVMDQIVLVDGRVDNQGRRTENPGRHDQHRIFTRYLNRWSTIACLWVWRSGPVSG